MPTFREDLHLGHEVAMVDTDDILDKAVTTDKLADGSVTTPKIADGAVTEQKIFCGAVTECKIANGAVTTQKIANGVVTPEKLNKRVMTEILKPMSDALWNAFHQQIVTSGTTTIGDDGYWYVDGVKTDIKAHGEDAPIPLLKPDESGINLIISYDEGETWFPFIVDYNKLRVLGYVESVELLPRSAQIGDIYGVWNPSAPDGRGGTGAYDMYINTVTEWEFDDNITKVYEYETELPQSATDGTVSIVEESDLTLDKEKIDGYKVYKYDLATYGWIMLLNTSEIFANKDDILNHGDNVYALVQGDEPHKYELYKRKVEWVFFGTNASITYHLVQNIEEGTETNILSGKSVKDRFNQVEENYGHYIESPEFIRVYLDNEDRVLWGIQRDGNIYFGAGCPQQVKSYIQEQIDVIMGAHDVTEAIDSVKEIIAFLETFKNSDTLAEVLAQMRSDIDADINSVDERKVDKVAGKSLINKEYADGVSYENNPEFVKLYLDSKGSILWGIKADGSIYYGAGIPPQVKDYVDSEVAKAKPEDYDLVVAFLDDFIGSNTTLKMLLDGLDGKMYAEAQRAEGVEEIISQRTKSIENKTSEIDKVAPASEDEEIVIVTDDGNPVTSVTAKKATDDNDVVEFHNDSDTGVYARIGVVGNKKGVFAQNFYDLNGNPIQAFEVDTENEVMIIGDRKYKLIPYVE